MNVFIDWALLSIELTRARGVSPRLQMEGLNFTALPSGKTRVMTMSHRATSLSADSMSNTGSRHSRSRPIRKTGVR